MKLIFIFWLCKRTKLLLLGSRKHTNRELQAFEESNDDSVTGPKFSAEKDGGVFIITAK